jgi:hypothetical protein
MVALIRRERALPNSFDVNLTALTQQCCISFANWDSTRDSPGNLLEVELAPGLLALARLATLLPHVTLPRRLLQKKKKN